MSARPTHPCAVCPRQINAGLLMCASHWRLVPHEQQREVNRTWRAFNGASGPTNALAARKTYLAARDAAVESAQAAIRLPDPTTSGAAP